jgi:hypothetical protein
MRRLVFLALLLALVAGIPAQASTFFAMDQRALIKDSMAVIDGEVLQVHSFWDPSGRMMITDAIIRVTDSVMGNAGSAVVVRTFGGTVEGYTVKAEGFPTFKRGERLLLFIEPERDGAHRIAGYQQGQYRIVRGKDGQDVAIPTMDSGATLLTRDGRPAARPSAMALDALKNQVRTEALRLGRIDN